MSLLHNTHAITLRGRFSSSISSLPNTGVLLFNKETFSMAISQSDNTTIYIRRELNGDSSSNKRYPSVLAKNKELNYVDNEVVEPDDSEAGNRSAGTIVSINASAEGDDESVVDILGRTLSSSIRRLPKTGVLLFSKEAFSIAISQSDNKIIYIRRELNSYSSWNNIDPSVLAKNKELSIRGLPNTGIQLLNNETFCTALSQSDNTTVDIRRELNGYSSSSKRDPSVLAKNKELNFAVNEVVKPDHSEVVNILDGSVVSLHASAEGDDESVVNTLGGSLSSIIWRHPNTGVQLLTTETLSMAISQPDNTTIPIRRELNGDSLPNSIDPSVLAKNKELNFACNGDVEPNHSEVFKSLASTVVSLNASDDGDNESVVIILSSCAFDSTPFEGAIANELVTTDGAEMLKELAGATVPLSGVVEGGDEFFDSSLIGGSFNDSEPFEAIGRKVVDMRDIEAVQLLADTSNQRAHETASEVIKTAHSNLFLEDNKMLQFINVIVIPGVMIVMLLISQGMPNKVNSVGAQAEYGIYAAIFLGLGYALCGTQQHIASHSTQPFPLRCLPIIYGVHE